MHTHHFNQTELAKRWKISPRTLERWRFTGEGPQFVKIGNRVIYRFEDILAYENDQIRQITPGMHRNQAERLHA